MPAESFRARSHLRRPLPKSDPAAPVDWRSGRSCVRAREKYICGLGESAGRATTPQVQRRCGRGPAPMWLRSSVDVAERFGWQQDDRRSCVYEYTRGLLIGTTRSQTPHGAILGAPKALDGLFREPPAPSELLGIPPAPNGLLGTPQGTRWAIQDTPRHRSLGAHKIREGPTPSAETTRSQTPHGAILGTPKAPDGLFRIPGTSSPFLRKSMTNACGPYLNTSLEHVSKHISRERV